MRETDRFALVRQGGLYGIRDNLAGSNILNGCRHLDEVKHTVSLLNEQEIMIEALHLDLNRSREKLDRARKTLSYKEFIKEHSGEKAHDIIAYELHLILEKMDEMIGYEEKG